MGILISAPWFWRNYRLTGAWTGLGEDVVLSGTSLWERLGRIPDVDWHNAFFSILGSHIWFGAWSFLQVRSWMIHLFWYLTLVALCGLAFYIVRNGPVAEHRQYPSKTAVNVLASFYGFFWLGLGYHVLAIFLSQGESTSTGWYLYCLVAAEVLLITCGLLAISPAMLQPWVIPGGAILLGLLDLYTTHFLLIPYYTGIVSHRLNGSLAAFHIEQLRDVGLGEVLLRMAVNKPPTLHPLVLGTLWVAFLVATVALIVLSFEPCRQSTAAGANQGIPFPKNRLPSV
jgi:hypothetical protein